MKKKLSTVFVIAVIAAVIILFKFGNGFGIGFGIGQGKGDGNAKESAAQKEASKIEDDRAKEEVKKEQGSSEDVNKDATLKVSVVGNEYFYDNDRISLDDLIKKIKEVEGDMMIEVKDDNASLKAYNALLDKLTELQIPFTKQ
ncbi:hypothetical protein C3V36_09830 [Lachnospiraceae bacterium oral taxon 500]|nr:hypothetical protein C3V36_09830 [Lachnospiraceae bacterium oral taxon 500]